MYQKPTTLYIDPVVDKGMNMFQNVRVHICGAAAARPFQVIDPRSHILTLNTVHPKVIGLRVK
jgi:hypothetical protein